MSSTFLTVLIVIVGVFILGKIIFAGGGYAVSEDLRSMIEHSLEYKYASYQGIHNKGQIDTHIYLWTVDHIVCKSGKEFNNVQLTCRQDYIADPTIKGLPDCE